MKVVICSYGYAGYWAACWGELSKRTDLRVFTPETRYPYAADFLSGLPVQVLPPDEMWMLPDRVVAERPDVLLVNGWASKEFVATTYDPRLKDVKKLLIADTAWDGSLKQWLNRIRLARYVRQFDGMIVAGVRGRKFARRMGFPDRRIYTSYLGYDAARFDCERKSWPKRFCYVGCYAPVKGVVSLLQGYTRYRNRYGAESWPLDCYGRGELKPLLAHYEGVIDHGFLQPDALPMALKNEGVFVFPGLHDAWGVALAEACGSGLPVVVSDGVGGADDLVEDGVNGWMYKAGDVVALEQVLVRMHEGFDGVPAMGRKSQEKARFYAPGLWADRWMEAIYDICR